MIKYVSRYKWKGGLKDLEKAKHYIEILIELEGDGGKLSDQMRELPRD